jgi:hypothetical protein
LVPSGRIGAARPELAGNGSISLRRADGSIASGLDGSLLEVGRGRHARALGQQDSHGFFQFIVSGRRGDGGKSMVVRVVTASRSARP